MYKRILCPTDFSVTSLEAVRTAVALAKALNAELLLLHVIAPATPSPDAFVGVSFDPAEYESAWRAAAEPKLRQIAETLVDRSLTPRLIVLSGQPAQMIEKCAADEKADLIVIATHGMTGWRHYLMGSVAQKVVQHVSLPVLAVRGPKGS
jgi:universal stress protein A